MALTQRSWNGQERESQNSPPLIQGRRETENRQNALSTHKPDLDWIKIFAGKGNPTVTVSIVAEGKNLTFTASRRVLMQMGREIFNAIYDLEPGK
jgi:hypothetical protein